ncbi:type II toxin-antitoxin system RelE/ParE family toxin [Prosthecobacter sp.]|jgi:toxin ParE1/3/4|uniref:type II toxin-antitoxin system RelE/ParE family toxin n=1 Tax=Prosthecobacter sp. TaxID=1965333 RepID=UPI0037C533A0
MTVSYHPSAQDDVNEILDYYRKVGGELLADRFFQELMNHIQAMAAHPERFPSYLGRAPFRRLRLSRFPHVIVFRILKDSVRITVVKHEKRHPAYGMKRR